MPPFPKIDPDDILRRLRAGDRTNKIASDLGVPPSRISYWKRKFGFPRTFSPPKFDHGLVRVYHAQGYSDADIAAAVGLKGVARIGRIRRRMGLTANGRHSARSVAKRRAIGLAHKARRLASGGPASLYSLDGERYRRQSRQLAARYGLPEDLPRVAVGVVVALASGPRTARQLARELRRPSTNPLHYHRFDCSHRCGLPAKNYLTGLCRLGLVSAVKRRRGETTYLLTPHALRLLAGAGKEAV